MGINAYTVVSEFRFDVAKAVLGSEQLQGSVQNLSNTVTEAVGSIKGLGLAFVSSLSGMSTGLTGLLGTAIFASDKFMQSQLSFTQIIDSNMGHLTGNIDNLNDKMEVSRNIMKMIAEDARKYSVPASDLLELSKSMSAMLVPKGLAGTNFKGAIDISRNMLKSAPSLGIDPREVQGQLLRAIEGSASMGDTLFRRLISEAPEPFQQAKVKDAKGFNVLDATKRFNILNEAMVKFASNTELLAMRANTVSGMMQRVRDLFTGFSSVLKPIGDVLMPIILEAFNQFAYWIDRDGRRMIETFANFLKGFLENPKELILQLKQLMDAGKDLSNATSMAGLVVTFLHLKELFHFLKGVPVIGPALTAAQAFLVNLNLGGKLLSGINYAFTNMGSIFVKYLWPGLKILMRGLMQFAGWIMVFLIPLQGLGRAIARVKIETLEWFAKNAADVTDIMSNLAFWMGVIWTPIQDMIKGWEELFFMIIGGTYMLDAGKSAMSGFVEVLAFFGKVILGLWSTVRGVVQAIVDFMGTIVMNIMQIFENLKSGNFSNFDFGTENAFSNAIKGFQQEFDKSFARALNPNINGNVDNTKTVQQVNNYDVKMQNSFKEVLQPDRIAFTIKEQLEKASTNRTSGRSSASASLLNKAL